VSRLAGAGPGCKRGAGRRRPGLRGRHSVGGPAAVTGT